MKKELIIDALKDKKIVILGFGKEGISSYHFIRKYFPNQPLTIADGNENLKVDEYQEDKNLSFVLGQEYDRHLNDYDLILKTPGVNLTRLDYFIVPQKITSQTDLFIRAFGAQMIGVTGTKGKSTTSSLIYHILNHTLGNTLLAGNIGVPFFDIIDKINDETTIVAELSAHQLEYVTASPHVAILLNMFQEHLDHFNSFSNYQLAKLNITVYQNEQDVLIYNSDNQYIVELLKSHQYQRRFYPFSRQTVLADGAYSHDTEIILVSNRKITNQYELADFNHLPGAHNYYNIMAAILACKTRPVEDAAILNALKDFKGLEHRIEFVGKFRDISFYNDSISTIPEATIAAVNSLRKVDTLIIGGFDRGIDYQPLIDFLYENPIRNVVFMGPAGKRILKEWKKQGRPLPESFMIEDNFDKIVAYAYQNTAKNKICLLSPAASSYDRFKNFEERGRCFKEKVQKYEY
ncbi:MAG: UDP-N-acetylmuramoyl-L-alanine--D-glutamate ligase [Bacteroidales bacterium]|nr:UDP-N-acetylmuramoyl-L-alanine--D-glutamate ligase [Bacteroidales bacterium]